MEHTINALWFIIPAGIVLLSIWIARRLDREEPEEREPIVGDEIAILKFGVTGDIIKEPSVKGWQIVDEVTSKGFGTTRNLWYPEIAYYIYRLKADNKLYKW